MLQARVRDFLRQTPNGDVTGLLSGAYYEPGFNIMSPLELEFPVSDKISLYLRERADSTGTVFRDIDISTMSVTVVDPTNGQSVPFYLEQDGNKSIILYIINSLSLSHPVMRVRTLDVYVLDSTYDDFVTFRVLVDDENKNLHYIYVESSDMNNRESFTAQSRDVYLSTKLGTDHYLLFSPYAFLQETSEDLSDFSYPLNTIFYKRQDAYNNENYSYDISQYSHTLIRDSISLMNVPSYGKAGVLLMDNKVYKDIITYGVNSYIDLSISGELSGISDTFRINFTA